MANLLAHSGDRSFPPEGKKISDHLYELYKPSSGPPQVDVIFFSGFELHGKNKDAFWKTWSSDGKTVWPREYLGRRFPMARILAVSYESHDQTFSQIGENLVLEIIISESGVQDQCPVILVAHSLGGLIVKQFVLMAVKQKTEDQGRAVKIDKFLKNLSGVFYFGSPQMRRRSFETLPGLLHHKKNPLLENLETLSEKLKEEFSQLRDRSYSNIATFGIAEGLPTKTSFLGTNFLIVEEASARYDVDQFYTAGDKDHLSICKPKSEDDITFLTLEEFIRRRIVETVGTDGHPLVPPGESTEVLPFPLPGGNLPTDSTSFIRRRIVETVGTDGHPLVPGESTEVLPFPLPGGNLPTDSTSLEPGESTEVLPFPLLGGILYTHSTSLEPGERTEVCPFYARSSRYRSCCIIHFQDTRAKSQENVSDASGGNDQDSFSADDARCAVKRSTRHPFLSPLQLVKRKVLGLLWPAKKFEVGRVVEPRPEPINKSLYRLYDARSGQTAGPADVEADIIFFHGLQTNGDYTDAHWKTWLSDGEQTPWPQTFLREDSFPKARILTVSYRDALAKAKSRNGGVHMIAAFLGKDIIESHYDQRPVILVGHSIGGLVIKMVLLMIFEEMNDCIKEEEQNQFDRLENFIRNLRGVFYYATPHNGCKMNIVAKMLPRHSELLPFLKIFSDETFRMNEPFMKFRKKYGIPTFTIAESRPIETSWTRLWRSFELVVEPSSAIYDSDDWHTAPRENHMSICKPKDVGQETFRYLLDFITENVPEAKRKNNENSDQTTRHELESLPDGLRGTVKYINGSLYELYAPEGEPEVDIIFFHGLQFFGSYTDAFWKTWYNEEKKIFWPKQFLGERALPKARILAVSYDSSGRPGNERGHGDVYGIGKSLVIDIIESDRASVGRGSESERPVILVGHSLGGLIIKMFLLMAFDMKCNSDPKRKRDQARIARITKFIENVKGVFYYATPHGGSYLATFVSSTGLEISKVLRFLTTDSADTRRLNERFKRWRNKHKQMAFAVAEGRKLAKSGFKLEIVSLDSAKHDVDGCYKAKLEDHISVCKPKSTSDMTFLFLLGFVLENIPEAQATYSQEVEKEKVEKVRQKIREARNGEEINELGFEVDGRQGEEVSLSETRRGGIGQQAGTTH